MNKIIRYLNQNRIKVIITILIIVFIIVIINVINSVLDQSYENMQRNTTGIIDQSIPGESVISGENVSEEVTNKNIDIIKNFVEFCNNNDYQNAYNLLTDSCKQELFQTIEVFKTNYCDTVFETDMTYSLELWYYSTNTYTYRIIYSPNNILETGNISSENNKEDYITIVEEDTGDRLNINSFIEEQTINKSVEQDNIKVTVNKRFRYKNYEKYSIEIENNTNKTILLCDANNSNDICLVDSNQVEYDSIINEVPTNNLIIEPNTKKILNISFYKQYNLYRTVEGIRFKNIILDAEQYNINPENVTKLNINIDI